MLNRTEIWARHTQARVALEKAQRDFDDAERLHADGVVTRSQRLDAKSALDQAKAAFEIAQHNLRFSAIVAPSKGRIAKQLKEADEVIGAGQPMFEFVTELLVLRAGVTDRDVLFVSLGDSAQIRFDAHPNEVVVGKVEELSAAADARTGLYEVELRLRSKSLTLLPGMMGRAHIFTNHETRLPAVPVEALIDADADRGFVYVLVGSTVDRRAVTLGKMKDAHVFIHKGVSPGEQVIVEGATYLRDQSRVQVVGAGQSL
ncbi:MAG: efflux RND transporter periplasmic adaptor subunit [Candidatus Latescibacteria bacterium]|nr:efflux RND transporter periplasmic adaptor subunit [Candidatus Latescibacterota bacterium]